MRRIGEESFLTVKRGSGRNRLEDEIEITDDACYANQALAEDGIPAEEG